MSAALCLDWNLLFQMGNWDTRSITEESAVPGKTVVLKLNQQQIELLDKTVTRAGVPDREALIRRALREYSAKYPQKKAAPGAKP
jgi:hypothetical protein